MPSRWGCYNHRRDTEGGLTERVITRWNNIMSKVLAVIVQIMHRAMFIDVIGKKCPAVFLRVTDLVQRQNVNTPAEARAASSKHAPFPVEIAKCNHKDGAKDSRRTFGGGWGKSLECQRCGSRWIWGKTVNALTEFWVPVEPRPAVGAPAPKIPDALKRSKVPSLSSPPQDVSSLSSYPTGQSVIASSSAAAPAETNPQISEQEVVALECLRQAQTVLASRPGGLLGLDPTEMSQLGQLLGLPTPTPAFPDAGSEEMDHTDGWENVNSPGRSSA